MKKLTYLVSAAVAVCALAFSLSADTTYPGSGSRIDFFDKSGVRVQSTNITDYSSANIIFNTFYSDYDQRYLATTGQYGILYNESLSSIKIIPYGVEKYTMEVKVDEEVAENVKVGYEIIEEEATDSKTRAELDPNILCGKTIRFTIEAPEGEYPEISYRRIYTNPNFPYELTSFPAKETVGAMFRNWGTGVFIASQRQSELNYINSTGQFKKVEGSEGKWTYDFTMPNEPVELIFSTIKPDSEMLWTKVKEVLRDMYAQYNYTSTNSTNTGDTYFQQIFGETLSADMMQSVGGRTYGTDFSRFKQNCNKPTYILSYIPWINCFSAIYDVNLLLDQMEKFNPTEEEKAKIRAELYVMRSHMYWRLMQVYGKRWSESDNGRTYCAPLLRELNDDFAKLATMDEIRRMCYDDLDYATANLSGDAADRSDILIPDKYVALGVKMRIAMLSEDWLTAKRCADEIINAKPITKNEDLLSGFYKPADSWIWGAWNCDDPYDLDGDQNPRNRLYFWSFQSLNACNGHYPHSWNMGAGAISRDLYDAIEKNDIRASMFVMPGVVTPTGSAGADDLTKWYDPATLSANSSNPGMRFSSSSQWTIFNNSLKESTPAARNTFGPFLNISDRMVPVMFGSQMKFYMPTDMLHAPAAVVFMRTEEALLASAEASARLGDESAAINLLNQLNRMRGQETMFIGHGQDLIKEIERTYRIELWGEGHSWFNDKRWGHDIVRRDWTANDPTSGNWRPQNGNGTLLSTEANGWRMLIPQAFVNYNPGVDISLMGYGSEVVYETAAPAAKPAKKPVKADATTLIDEIDTEAHALVEISPIVK